MSNADMQKAIEQLAECYAELAGAVQQLSGGLDALAEAQRMQDQNVANNAETIRQFMRGGTALLERVIALETITAEITNINREYPIQ